MKTFKLLALDISNALGEASSPETGFSIESLSADDLLGADANVATEETAGQAASQVQQALNSVATTIEGINAFSDQLDFAAAFVETAIANQDASRATLSDADLAGDPTQLSRETIFEALEITIESQTNRLPPSLVQIIVE